MRITRIPIASMEEDAVEHGIADVARMAGTTSRTLRHYDDIGLLAPTRVAGNGYRYYDRAALTRLQRILLLRELGLGLPAVAEALQHADDASALRTHLAWLRQESDRIERQMRAVQRTIEGIENEEDELMAQEMFDGFDHTQFRDEVQERWGSQAWADGDRWWRGLGTEGQAAFQAEHAAITQEWARLRAAGAPIDGPEAVANARRHRDWIRAGWQGREPTAEALAGLADMYVADERFARTYGGAEGATYVRDALTQFAVSELA